MMENKRAESLIHYYINAVWWRITRLTHQIHPNTVPFLSKQLPWKDNSNTTNIS